MNPVQIIALCGRRGTGKTTASLHLLCEHKHFRVRFADRLKKMLRLGLGIPTEYIDGSKKNEPCKELVGQTARHAMVTLGTEWGRNMIHPDLWVNALHRDIKTRVEQGVRKFVIDDLRFLTEVEWLLSLRVRSEFPVNVTIIKLVRDGLEKSDHQSEREVDLIQANHKIVNNGTIDDLHNMLDGIIQYETNGGF